MDTLPIAFFDILQQENDDDIGALGSILSWDDDDDVVVTPAPSTMVEQRQTLTGAPMFPQQISVMGMTQLPGQQQIQQVNPFAGYTMVTQMPQQQQQQMQSQQHQQLIQQHQQPQRVIQVASKEPSGQQFQMMHQHYATMYQQPMYTDQQIQTIPVMQSSSQAANLQPFMAASDPHAFLRQMQAAQTLQFSVQPQQQPSTSTTVPQSQPVQINPQQATDNTSKLSRLKRKTPEQTQSNVVSSSDTDGESRGRGTVSDATSIESKPTKVTLQLAPMPPLSASEDYMESEIDTSNMTTAEKAKANRDRNREHARNTRLRKKAYLEKLKTTVDELCRERDTLVSERAGAANLLVEMHNTRTEVLMSFFALRSTYEKQRELWSSILDESCFACVMPVTPYRSFPASEVQVSKCQRTIMGIDGVMTDTASLHVLLNSLIDRSRYPTAGIQFRYTLVTEDAVVAGNQMMARWVMSTLNATQCGARMEVAKQGMLCAKFNSSHKIIGLELMFDVMAFMLQLKQASGSELFSVVPNTVQTCQRSFDVPMVMTLAERPYTIVQVNKLWEEMTGYFAEDVVGKASCRILQGQDTDHQAVESLMNEIRYKRPTSAMVLHYNRQGKRFRNFLSFFPLSTDSKITHYVALTAHVDNMNSIACAAPPAIQGQQQSQVAQHVLPKPLVAPPPTVLLPGIPGHAQIASPGVPQLIATSQGGAPPVMTFYHPQPIPSMPGMLPSSIPAVVMSASAIQH